MSATSAVDAPRARSSAGRLQALPPTTSGPRQRRVELLLGVVLVVGGALAALVMATSGRDRTPVLALARDVERGAVVESGDLAVRYVAADNPIAHVDRDERDTIVGQTALSDMGSGTIVTRDLFAEAGGVPPAGDGSVGLALEAGQMPTMELAPGDRVNVVAAGGQGQGTAGPVVTGAEVIASDRLDDDTGGWWVSLRAPESDANAVAEAAASDARLHLVLVSR